MKKLTSAFSLIEVTIALSIAAFSLVSILGLIPVGLNSSASAKRQTEAVSILSSITADLRSTPLHSGTSSRYGIPIGTDTTLYFSGMGVCSGQLDVNSQYCVVLTTPYKPSSSERRATWARVRVSWPAGANVNIPQGVVETSISLDRN